MPPGGGTGKRERGNDRTGLWARVGAQRRNLEPGWGLPEGFPEGFPEEAAAVGALSPVALGQVRTRPPQASCALRFLSSKSGSVFTRCWG